MDNDPYSDERNLSRLKDLAERLLDYDYHVEAEPDKPRLFLGELPTDLPTEIPVPEGLVLLGGVRRVSPWRGGPEAEVVLEAEAEPEDVYDAFREHLAGTEWSEKRRPLGQERGGLPCSLALTGVVGRKPRMSACVWRAPGATRPAPTITTVTLTTSALSFRRCSRRKGWHNCRAVGEAVRVRKKPTPTYGRTCPPRRSWNTTRHS